MPRTTDVGLPGGPLRFSAGMANGRINVTSVNDAPVIRENSVVTLPSINENVASASITVGALLNLAGATDVDVGALSGMAVTSALGNGRWQYSTDGLTWTNIVSVSATSALLLNAQTQLRYQPDLLNGEQVSLAFRAWT